MSSEDEATASLKAKMPFLFPGAVPEGEEPNDPPFHPELEQYSFFELYAFIFEKMLIGEKVIDCMKRIDKSPESIDEIAKWISELFVRGEIDIISTDWVMTGIRAGKVGQLQDMKWDLKENGEIKPELTYETIAPRLKVLIAEDSLVKPVGTEEWVPIDKIHFEYLE